MRKLLVAFLVSCAFGAFANEWYVDPVNGNDTYDGTSSNVVSDTTGPRRTLVGIMELVGNNDTIWLLPGDYAEKSVVAEDDSPRRLEIANKTGLKFRSVAGRDKTAIVGRHDGANGYDGADAIGGVKLSSGSVNCVFEGITFRDCAAEKGGGCRDLSQTCWFIGCSFTNCLAKTGGAMIQGNASGTEFVDCGGASSTMNSMIGYNVGTMEFCLFRHIDATGRYLFQQGGTFINCTVYGMSPVYSGPVCFYNSLVFGAANNGAYQADVLYVTNSWLGVAKYVNVGENSVTNADERAVRFVSPAMGDFRLTDLSEVTGLGDAAYLALSPFPEGFVRRDVYGNPVTAMSGAIPAGCALEVVHQTGARVDFSNTFEVQDLGYTFNSGDYFNQIRTGDDYTYMIRPVTDNNVVYVRQTIKEYFFPLRQKGGWVPVGILPDLYSTNKFSFSSASAANTYYADPINGNDDYDGKSSNVVDAVANKGPFKTLMGAMGKIDTGNENTVKILYLMPGTYAEGQTEKGPTSTKVEGVTGVCYRVCIGTVKTMAIVGLEGPEKTFIVGAPDPDTGGIGPNAVGGVWLKSGTVRAIQGVTITGCYSTDMDSTSYLVGGCAFFGGGSDTTFCFDCVISNNVGNLKPAQSYGRMSRCKILNNRATTGLTDWGSVSSCVFAGNTITSSGCLTGVGSYGCTFDTPSGVEYANKQNTYYSLLLNHRPGSGSGYLKQSCVDTIPLVTDQETFDYRLGSLSPAILFGDVSARTESTTYRLVCDVNGDRLQIKDGKMTVGAVHGGLRAPCVAISNGGVAGTTVAGGDFGTNVVKTAGEITLTASATRPLEGFSVNGEVVPATERSYTFTPSAEPDAATFVEPVYGTNWFVDVVNGSDVAPGGTPATARQTIRSATTNAVAGDVIHVAPGTYGEAEGAETIGSLQLKNRVILPEGVTLVSDEGAAKTFIVGADDPDPARCVYAYKDARICGFTLTGGHTLKADATSDDDRYAAMVHSADATVRVEDCIITNNTTFGRGLLNGRIIRCFVVDNYTSNPDHGPTATTGKAGTAGYGNYWYGCIIDRIQTAYPICGAKRIESCTLGPTFGKSQFIDTLHGKIYNTVFRGGRTYQVDYATNCLMLAGISTLSDSRYAPITTHGDSIVTNEAAMVFDENYCPVLGSNAGIDAGEVKYASSYLGDKDIYGNPRVSNGKMDIGAVEYDWRGRYKEDLGRHATAVTAASPEVVETESGTVRIPSGALVGTLKPGEVQLNFTVTGGTLAVYLGETLVDEFAASADPQGVKLEPTEENNEFRLAFTPTDADGYAEIARMKGLSGMLLIVR